MFYPVGVDQCIGSNSHIHKRKLELLQLNVQSSAFMADRSSYQCMSVHEIEALQIKFNISQSTVAGMRGSIELP